jgi:hypothetical protein
MLRAATYWPADGDHNTYETPARDVSVTITQLSETFCRTRACSGCQAVVRHSEQQSLCSNRTVVRSEACPKLPSLQGFFDQAHRSLRGNQARPVAFAGVESLRQDLRRDRLPELRPHPGVRRTRGRDRSFDVVGRKACEHERVTSEYVVRPVFGRAQIKQPGDRCLLPAVSAGRTYFLGPSGRNDSSHRGLSTSTRLIPPGGCAARSA